MRRSAKRFACTLAFVLACGLSAGGALAGNGGGNGNGNGQQNGPPSTAPGNSGNAPGRAGTAPGQEKKAEATQTKAAKADKRAKALKASPRSKPSRTGANTTQAAAPQASAGKVTICHRTGSATNPFVQITISRNALAAHMRHGDPAPTGGACPGATQTGGQGAERSHGHEKVTICHRTGSATNPYVVITIARAGWENGHSKHEGDRILGPGDNPAQLCVSQQGGAAGVTAPTSSGCPTTTTVEVPVGVWHATGSKKNPFVFITPSLNSAHYDRSKHPDDRIVTETRTVVTGSGSCAAAAPVPPSGGAVLGASAAPPVSAAPAAAPAQAPAAGVRAAGEQGRGSEGGVLGAGASLGSPVTRTTLPFTGFPLWLALLLGSGLVVAGLGIRRVRTT